MPKVRRARPDVAARVGGREVGRYSHAHGRMPPHPSSALHRAGIPSLALLVLCVPRASATPSTVSLAFSCRTSTTTTMAHKYGGVVQAGGGDLFVFAPLSSPCVGTYRVSSGVWRCVIHNVRGEKKFRGAVYHPLIQTSVFAPNDANCIGLFDAVGDFRCKDISSTPTASSNRFWGAAYSSSPGSNPNDAIVVFAPANADCIGVLYDGTDTFECIPLPASVGWETTMLKFAGAATIGGHRVIFAPLRANCVGIYDVHIESFTCVDIGRVTSAVGKFMGAAACPSRGGAPSSQVVFAPHNSGCIGVFDLTGYSTGVFRCVRLPATITATSSFGGADVLPNGNIVFAPLNANCIGVFNPATDDFYCVDVSSSVSGTHVFGDVAVLASGTGSVVAEAIFAPKHANCVGRLTATSCETEACATG